MSQLAFNLTLLVFAGVYVSADVAEPIQLSEELLSREYQQADGGDIRLGMQEKSKAVVLVFFGHDCPISNRYVPELKRLCAEFKDIEFCVVYADSDLTAKQAAKHAADYDLPCAAILDPKLDLAAAVGATIKPEVAVLSPKGKLLYRGRIDNRYSDFGVDRVKPSERNLHDVLISIVADKELPQSTITKAIGCDIDFSVRDKK